MTIDLKDFKKSDKDNKPKSSDHLYLEQLEFNPELKKSWLNFFVVNFRVVILLIIVLTSLGIYSFSVLPRESNPEVKIPFAAIITTYPGASPTDIEELVTKKIETGISGIKDIKKISSNSSNSVSAVTVEFDSKANLDDSIRKLRDQVNTITDKLPADANEPIVKEISLDDAPIWTFSISGPYDGFVLREAAEDIKDELEKNPGIREIVISGGSEKEFQVEYDPQKLSLYNVSVSSANAAIAAANTAIPAGNFDGLVYSYAIRTDGRYYDAKALANIPLLHTDEGAIVYLKDVAIVREGAIKKETYSRLSFDGKEPRENVTLQIIKKTGGNIIETIDSGKKTLETELAKMPSGITYSTTIDLSEQIDSDFEQLTHDFILTIILVFTILFLIVGFKEALVAGLAVPLVFFATFGVMLFSGITLNFLSLFSLILSLGLLVDDAIVVVSATKQYLGTGKFTPEEAVLLVLNDFKVVLVTTTLTTIWAFLPLLMASGIIGEFIKSIPITVSVTLSSSLLIALMVNHPLAAILERIRLTRKMFFLSFVAIISLAILSVSFFGITGIIISVLLLGLNFILVKWYLKKGKKELIANEELVAREWDDDELIKKKLSDQAAHDNDNFFTRLMHGILNFNVFLPIYEKYLKKILRSAKTRWTTLLVVGLLFVLAITLPATGIVKNEFFPASDEDTITVNIEAATGLRLSETDKITAKVENILLQYKDIDNFSTIIGQSTSDSSTASGLNSYNKSSITIRLKPSELRQLKSYELADKINTDTAFITEATIKAESAKGGPPSGAAFEAQIQGEDLQVLDKIARDLNVYLKDVEGVVSTDISLKDTPADYTFTLNHERLELYNLNAAYVGSILRMAISGVEVTTVIKDSEEIKVIAKFNSDKLPDLSSIQNLQIINLRGQSVFLKDVAKVELQPSISNITRVDQKRTVKLTASLKGESNASVVLEDFQKKIKDYQLPSDYEIKYGGENEQNQESVLSILRAMIVAFFLIISTLVIQFNSFRRAIIVLATIPLALIGVFFGLGITGIPLSFPGLIGILALFGIVVKNAIILVDKIDLNLKSGIDFKDSIIDAGKSRLEAIFITSICTILGIIPITLSNATWQALGGSIIFGLLLSSFLTLFIVPTMFMTFVKEKKKFN